MGTELIDREGWGQDLCRFTNGRRSRVSYWWRCGAWCLIIGGDAVAGWVFYVEPVVSVVAVFKNVEDKLWYGNMCICSWAAYRMERNLLCVFRKSVKLYLSQQAGYPFPLSDYVLCQVCLGQTRMISFCIRQSHSTETQHIVQTTTCF